MDYIAALKKYITMYNIKNVELVSTDLDENKLLELKRVLDEV